MGARETRVAHGARMNASFVPLLARVLLAGIFIGLGSERLLGATGVGPLAGTAISSGNLVLSALELTAGLLLAIGWQVRILALLIAVFLVADAFLAHPFWRYHGAEAHGQWLHFLKNLAIVGGLLLLATIPRGRR